MYDISTVSINESFAPLMGLNMTFNNNMTLKMEYRSTRVLNLSLTSAQLNETASKDFVIGWGYKINDFKISDLFRSKKASARQEARNRINSKNGQNNRNGQANQNNTNTNSNNRSSKSNFAHSLSMRFDSASVTRVPSSVISRPAYVRLPAVRRLSRRALSWITQ